MVRYTNLFLCTLAAVVCSSACLAQNLRPRIMGGKSVAQAGEYPFFVQLERGCGGSMIAPDVLITAAHCFDNDSNRNFNVYVGSHQSRGGQNRTITVTSPHPMYNDETKEYDFLLAKLDKPVVNVTFVELNGNASLPLDMENLTVIGMGSMTAESAQGVHVLREAFVQVLPDANCSEPYGNLWREGSMLCAGTEHGGVDSCRGDSGGPLLDDNNTLMGVVSVGHHCGNKDFPGIYGRMSEVYLWARSSICFMSDHKPVELCGTPRPTSPPTSPPPTSPTPPVATIVPPTASPTELVIDIDEREDEEPEDPGLTLQLDIHYDAYAIENKWSLRNSDLDEVIDTKSFYATAPEGLTTYTYKGLPAGSYSFKFEDFAKDGICCKYGQGYIQLSQVDDETKLERQIWFQHGDDFTDVAYIRFPLIVPVEVPQPELETSTSNTTGNATSANETDANVIFVEESDLILPEEPPVIIPEDPTEISRTPDLPVENTGGGFGSTSIGGVSVTIGGNDQTAASKTDP